MQRIALILYITIFVCGPYAGILHAQQFKFKNQWIDSVYNKLSETERIGQLFMVAAYSGGDKANQDKIEQLARTGQIGGVIFMQGTAEAQAKMTNKIQQLSKVKLMIGMDAEWGLGMRLKGVQNYPYQMMLGATKDTALVYEMGAAVAAQCKRLGVHVNFAPVVDVNNNPKNPVISFRSFGDNKEWVSKLGIAYMHGLQSNGVMACAKHFPGHGDVAVDSHLDLPIIKKTKQQLEETEFYPFKQLINAGVQSIMIAHLNIPALDDTKNLPTTLSDKVINGLLKKEMKFNGLVFTDALDMKGVTKQFEPGEVDLKAFMAGNDVLLFSQDVPLAINKIQWAIKTGKITPAYLEAAVKKILNAKYEMQLYNFKPIKEQNVTEDLNAQTKTIRTKITQNAITVFRNQDGILAKMKTGKPQVEYINVNGNKPLLSALLQKKYGSMVTDVPQAITAAAVKQIASNVKGDKIVVVGIHNLGLYAGKKGNYNLSETQIALLQQLATKKNVLFVHFGNAYAAKNFCSAKNIIFAYEDDEITEQEVYNVIIGKQQAKGSIPVQPCR